MLYLENGMIIVNDLDELKRIVQEKKIPLELIDIKESGLNSLDNVFYNIHEINGSIDNWDISNIKYLNSTFSYSKLKNIDISKWNTSNVENIHGIFYHSEMDLNIANWNTSKVKIMSFIFRGSTFNGDISNWDVSNVENLEFAFRLSNFQGDLSKWDVSNCETFEDMFSNCPFDGDISSWNFKNMKKANYMFSINNNFKNKYNSGNEIPNNTKDFIQWFEDNREKMKKLNQGTREEILDFFSFDHHNIELDKDI